VEVPPTTLTDHVVLIGHGRVGSRISEAVRASGGALLVVEDNADKTAQLREQGIETITGNAADPKLVKALNLPAARCLLVAIPDSFEGGQVVAQARGINADLPIIARSHSQDETAHLMKYGATRVVMGEEEIAKAMIADACAPDAAVNDRAYASEASLMLFPEQPAPSSAA
jgi:CPA2 family monovalent cation:H+ antiporter-2